jgi:hypothetical protein
MHVCGDPKHDLPYLVLWIIDHWSIVQKGLRLAKVKVITLMIGGCSSPINPSNPDSPPVPSSVDTSIVTTSETQATCGSACSKARLLGCEEGDPTPRGQSCEYVCETYQMPLSLRECFTHAQDCPTLKECQ